MLTKANKSILISAMFYLASSCLLADQAHAKPSSKKIPTRACVNQAGVITLRDRCKTNTETRFATSNYLNPVSAIPNPARVLHVSSSGTAYSTIDAAVTAASDLLPTADDPVLIKVAPGTFQVSSSGLVLPQHVSLEGSGVASTILQLTGADGIQLSDNNLLTRLQISSSVTVAQTMMTAQLAGTTNRLYDIEFNASIGASGAAITGFRLSDGTALIDKVRMVITNSTPGTFNFGVVVEGGSTTLNAHNLEIDITSEANYAMSVAASASATLSDTTLTTHGTSVSNTTLPIRIGSPGTKLRALNCYLHNINAGSTNETVYVSTATDVEIDNSRLVSEPGVSGSGNGMVVVDDGGSLLITNSTVQTASTSAGVGAYGAGSVIKVSNSRLSGGATVTSGGGAVTCAGVTDKNFTFSASSCP